MAGLLALSSLIVAQTKTVLYDFAIDVAETVLGEDVVTSWQPGDPTRSLYHALAEMLAALEASVVRYVRSGFLEYATGTWLQERAFQSYGVTYIAATYATTDVTITNTGGGEAVWEAGDLTFLNTSTGATYRNTTGGTLAPGVGQTLTVTVVADVAGSASSAGVGDIDDLVVNVLGVTCSNAAAAVALDVEEDEPLRVRCRNSLGALSPNGPAAAYVYVATTPALSLAANVTRARAYGDSVTGHPLLVLAGPSGAVTSDDRSAVELAIVTYAMPLCITPEVVSASNVSIPVTYSLWIYTSVGKTEAEIEAAIETALHALFVARPVGGDIIAPASTGKIYRAMILAKIQAVYPSYTFQLTVSAPSGDTALANDEVAILGSVTPTITFEAAP